MVSRGLAIGLAALAIAVGVALVPGAQSNPHSRSLVLFAAACALGILFEFFAQFGMGGLAFWITQVRGTSAAFQFVKAFLGATSIIPVSALPESWVGCWPRYPLQ